MRVGHRLGKLGIERMRGRLARDWGEGTRYCSEKQGRGGEAEGRRVR